MTASVAANKHSTHSKAASAALLARFMHYSSEIISAPSSQHAAQIVVRRLHELMPLQRALLVQLKPKFQLLTTNSGHQNLRSGKLLSEVKKLHKQTQNKSLAEHSDEQGHTLWLPILTDGYRQHYALCLQRSTPWADAEKNLLQRLLPFFRSGLFQHQKQHSSSIAKPLRWAVGLAGSVIILAWPVQQSFVANAEVVASAPATVYAPLSAVIERVYVSPGSAVSAGTPLLKLDDKLLLQQINEASENVAVELAELSRLQSAGLSDASARANLPVQRLKVTKAQAALSYQQSLLARTNLVAAISGVVTMPNITALEGAAVQLGEELLSIADPTHTELLLQVPVKDRGLFRDNAEVTLRLDSAPLNTIGATTTRINYDVSSNSSDQPVVEARAKFNNRQVLAGQRGSARIYGNRTHLGWQLMRKPALALIDTFGY